MPLDGRQVGPQPRGAKKFLTFTLFYIGAGIYVVSFFLPAVNADFSVLVGWQCAWLAFFTLGGVRSLSQLAFFGALINPLAITHIALRIFSRAPRVRIGLASAILLFIPLTWLSLFGMHFGIRIGHVAWIVGLLLMISWTDFRRGLKQDPKSNLLSK